MITTLRPLHQARPEEECLPVWWPSRRPTTGAKQSFICIKDHQDCYRRGPSLNEELSHDWCKCPIAPPLWLEVGHVAHVRASRDASCETSCVLTLSPIKASPRCFFFHIYFWSLLVDQTDQVTVAEVSQEWQWWQQQQEGSRRVSERGGRGAGPMERRGDERCEELNRRNCGPQLLKSSKEQSTWSPESCNTSPCHSPLVVVHSLG